MIKPDLTAVLLQWNVLLCSAAVQLAQTVFLTATGYVRQGQCDLSDMHFSLHVCHLDRAECESCQGLFRVTAADACCLFALPHCYSLSLCGCILILLFHVARLLKSIRLIPQHSLDGGYTGEHRRWKSVIWQILSIGNVFVIGWCIESASLQHCGFIYMLYCFLI